MPDSTTKQPPFVMLFDWDGTLADSAPNICAAFNHVFELMARKYDYPEETWTIETTPYFNTTTEIFNDKYSKHGEEALQHYIGYRAKFHLKELKHIEGATEVLQTLHRAIIPVGIVSNKRHQLLKKEVDYLEAGPYVSAVVGIKNDKAKKPSPAMLERALTTLNIPQNSGIPIYMVGDNVIDFLPARGLKGYDCYPIIFGEVGLQAIQEEMSPEERKALHILYPGHPGQPGNYGYVANHQDLLQMVTQMIETGKTHPPFAR